MSNSIAPGSSTDVNVKVTALTTNQNVPVTYKTIILKKNLVNGVNTLTQEMMSTQNTKYIIKYDYVLGEDITVPVNCVLKFDGGSISSEHNITGQNTGIEAGLVKVFNTDVTIAGSWDVVEAYPEWFGAKGDGVTDCTNIIQKTINTFNDILFSATYLFTTTITIAEKKKLVGNNAILIYTGTNNAIEINGQDIHIEGFKINVHNGGFAASTIVLKDGSSKSNLKDLRINTTSTENSNGIDFISSSNIGIGFCTIDNCRFYHFGRAVRMNALQASSGISWINSNKIINCTAFECKTIVLMNAASGGSQIIENDIEINYQANASVFSNTLLYDIASSPMIKFNKITGDLWDIGVDTFYLGSLGYNTGKERCRFELSNSNYRPICYIPINSNFSIEVLTAAGHFDRMSFACDENGIAFNVRLIADVIISLKYKKHGTGFIIAAKAQYASSEIINVLFTLFGDILGCMYPSENVFADVTDWRDLNINSQS